MEEDILNHSPTVMFRGTPCISLVNKYHQVSDYENSESRILLYKDTYEDHLYPVYCCTRIHMRIICIQYIVVLGYI